MREGAKMRRGEFGTSASEVEGHVSFPFVTEAVDDVEHRAARRSLPLHGRPRHPGSRGVALQCPLKRQLSFLFRVHEIGQWEVVEARASPSNSNKREVHTAMVAFAE